MPDPSVRGLLLHDLDELLAAVTRALDHIQEVTDQLSPERAKACRSYRHNPCGSHGNPRPGPRPTGRQGGALNSPTTSRRRYR